MPAASVNIPSRPNIVVLDGFTANPGDISWSALKSLGNLRVHNRTADELIVRRASDAHIVLTNKTPLAGATLEQLQSLRYIGVLATGYNVVDVEAARAQQITITNVPAYGTQSVAQMVLAHVLNFTQRVAQHAQLVREGRWASAEDWCCWETPLQELDGLTMGIVGLGQIGLATAKLANAFGMQTIACTRTPRRFPEFIRLTDLETVLRTADIVSLHCPLTPETDRLMNRDRFLLMKPTAMLINTARGRLVDEHALVEALQEGRLAAAGLDVMECEPPPADSPLYAATNCEITPHIAWATQAARARLIEQATANVAAFLAGTPINVVSE